MKGISQEKAKENSIRYRRMYEQWSTDSTTLERMGKEHNLTKQRMWQNLKHSTTTQIKLKEHLMIG